MKRSTQDSAKFSIVSTVSLTALAISLAGCSFKEDRNDVDVPIVDASPAHVYQNGNRNQAASGQTDPQATYIYTVRSGDTLGTIAYKYLGSSRRYTELMELNELDTNDAIYVGQRLKLPTNGLQLPQEGSLVEAQKSSTQNTASTQPSSPAKSYPELEALLSAEQYNQAIQWLLNHSELENDPQLQQQLVNAAVAQTDIYQRQQKVGDAETLLSGLVAEAPVANSYKQRLEVKLSTLRAEQQLLVAKRYADQSQYDQSYDVLLNAWQKVGTPLEDNILFTGTRSKVSEHYHQKALRLYRNQELDEALNYWEKILALNPNDDLALVYQDRVKALQNRLDNL